MSEQTGQSTSDAPPPSADARDQIIEAQQHTVYWIAGAPLARVRYGDEPTCGAPPSHPCSDCHAAVGELHVPGCEHEACPACGEAVIGCDCAYGRRSS